MGNYPLILLKKEENKMNRKLVSVILTIAMIFGMLSVVAFAKVAPYKYVGGDISKFYDGTPVCVNLSDVLATDNGFENTPLACTGLYNKYVVAYYSVAGSDEYIPTTSEWTEDGKEYVYGPSEVGDYTMYFVRPDDFAEDGGTVFFAFDFTIVYEGEPPMGGSPIGDSTITDATPDDATPNDATPNDAAGSGDINGDGKVSVADAKWVLQAVAQTRDLTEEQKLAADVNGDSKLSVLDAKWILQVVAGLRVL